MKIGYPCINRTLGCAGAKTFRLKSYSLERLDETVRSNLSCLEAMLQFNVKHGTLFFRITSDLVPFASHPEAQPPWSDRYVDEFERIGSFIRENEIRIDMHPGQYTLLNAKEPRIVTNAIRDLQYHCDVLDLMELDETAKVQIHVGGVYGDREASMQRFVDAVGGLPRSLRRRLVIENDERSYPLPDCLGVSAQTGCPVVLDVYHHSLLNHGESLSEALAAAAMTWKAADGLPIVDYSSPLPRGRFGRHADTLDPEDFGRFLKDSLPNDFDVMLEIKDKEVSALRAVALAQSDPRFALSAINPSPRPPKRSQSTRC